MVPSHAGIVADQFHLIAFGVAHIKRAPMHPCVFGGFDLKPQRLQSLPFACEIVKRYLECDVVDSGSCSVRPSITRSLGAVEQGEYLRVTVVALSNLEERDVWKSGHQRQADDFLVESLHGIQIA